MVERYCCLPGLFLGDRDLLSMVSVKQTNKIKAKKDANFPENLGPSWISKYPSWLSLKAGVLSVRVRL